MQGFITPHNLDAEVAVLGGLLFGIDNEASESVLQTLKPESFYNFAHKEIFKTIREIFAKNQPVDLLTVDSNLKAKGILNDVGGFAYLAELTKNTPSRANIKAYAQIVKDEAVKRFAITKLNECERLMYEKSTLTAEERLDAVSRLMSEISDHSKSGKIGGLRASRDVALEYLGELQRYHTEPETAKGLGSGLEDLDRLIGVKGLVKQSLAVVGARPKCGKTAFYAMVATNCVMQDKKTALLFSLEMNAKQLFERMIGKQMNLNTLSLYDRNIPQYQRDEIEAKLAQGVAELVDSDLMLIDDTPNVSIAHIRNECRRIKRERGEIGLIAVDYLTLMKAEKAERNDLAYGNLTKDLKNLAREMDCVVLLLTQLNRKLEDRADKRPYPSDSRDTGQIEQECDYWFGIYKESVYNEKADKSLTEIHLRLNRYGDSGGMVYCDQRWGNMFPCDQKDGERRSQIGKPEPKSNRKSKDF